MVRTKADGCGRKAVAAKAPRKQVGGGSSGGCSSGAAMTPDKSSAGGGNQVRWWPTPEWQKGVDSFFTKIDKTDQSNKLTTTNMETASSSSNESTIESTADQDIKELEN
ncbi:PCNA-associated factor [Nematostella vectensis]|uniref:PCNA-associated factor n=1 Tax=Nematostella vectensis TaxID=45351 RepID=UPI002077153E|nr:PCNA-associated factor [Nematostella vectensis]